MCRVACFPLVRTSVGAISPCAAACDRRGAQAGEMNMGYKVAVVGATGNVGREMLNILAERTFPADEGAPLASRRSVGSEVSDGDRTLKVKALEHYDFSEVDICLMSAGSGPS